MADIKTRDTVKGTIKTLDKATVAGQKMKEATQSCLGVLSIPREIAHLNRSN